MTDATSSNDDGLKVEQRALAIGKWANLLMCFAGVATAYLSRSDAMLVDGLYSGVNFISAIIAAGIGARVILPADRSRPWGYDFDEAIYVTFRSLILVGILAFAGFTSGSKIVTFFTGGDVPDLIFGPIAVYAVAMVVICCALAVVHYRAYVKTGRKSAILQTESRAALVDGALSFGAGAALLSLPYLTDTPLGPYVQIGDAVIVVLLVVLMIWQPLGMFRRTLADLAGTSAPGETVAQVSRTARDLAKEYDFRFHRAGVLRAGRTHYAGIYIDPERPVDAAEVDAFKARLHGLLTDRVGRMRTEVIVTAEGGKLPKAPG